MTITREWLEKHGACPEGMEWFFSVFPKTGMEITKENIDKFKDHEDYLLWLLLREFEITEEFINNGVNVHMCDDELLYTAVACNRFQLCELLLKYGANVHMRNDLPLRMSSVFGLYEICKLLLEYGADVHVLDDFPYKTANLNGYVEIVALLKKWMEATHASR